jgi:hypothetical protein
MVFIDLHTVLRREGAQKEIKPAQIIALGVSDQYYFFKKASKGFIKELHSIGQLRFQILNSSSNKESLKF